MTPHLDDEQLSAHLDGEAGEDAGAAGEHLDSCADCRGRLGQLQEVVAQVGRPPAAVTDARRDAAVEAAVGAWSAVRAGPGAVVPLPRHPVPHWVLGAAAAAVAVLVAVSLLAVSRGGEPGDDTAAPAPSFARRARTATPTAVVPPTDLGDQPDTESLARAVRAALASRGDTAGREGAATREDTLSPATAGDFACLGAARRLAGADLELVYTASVRFRGTPGVVHVFRSVAAASTGPQGARLAHRVLVMAREGCGLLVAQAL
jgi:hypothetical protein